MPYTPPSDLALCCCCLPSGTAPQKPLRSDPLSPLHPAFGQVENIEEGCPWIVASNVLRHGIFHDDHKLLPRVPQSVSTKPSLWVASFTAPPSPCLLPLLALQTLPASFSFQAPSRLPSLKPLGPHASCLRVPGPPFQTRAGRAWPPRSSPCQAPSNQRARSARMDASLRPNLLASMQWHSG